MNLNAAIHKCQELHHCSLQSWQKQKATQAWIISTVLEIKSVEKRNRKRHKREVQTATVKDLASI